MRLNQKGQLFSLDLFIAIVVIVLAIGLLMQQFETLTYRQNSALSTRELQEVARVAAQKLVTSPELVCNLMGTGRAEPLLDALPNCWPQTLPDQTTIDSVLGLKPRFNYCIVLGSTAVGSPCPNPLDASNVVAIERSIVQLNSGGSISKKEFMNCLEEDDRTKCTTFGASQSLVLKVWQ